MAKRGNWQRWMARKNDKAFQSTQQKVLERDKNTCLYCHFQSDQFMTVVNQDHNYDNNVMQNFATACSLCAQCFFLESVGADANSGGYMIQLPDVSQADVNHFARALFCSLLREAPYRGKLQTLYLSVQERGKPVEAIFGPGTNHPGVFGQTLIDSGITPEQLNHPVMKSLRVFPQRKAFRAQSEYWRSTTFATIPI